MGHYIENTGEETLTFLEMFRSDRFADVSLSQWLAPLHHPRRQGNGRGSSGCCWDCWSEPRWAPCCSRAPGSSPPCSRWP
jgi:hypothetical protein